MAASIRESELLPVLEFAIGLARQNLQSVDDGERAALVDGFLRALGRESKGVWGRRVGIMVHNSFREQPPESFGQRDFHELKEAIQRLLGTVRSNAIRATALPSLRFVLLTGTKRRQLQVAGSARDVFLYLLHAALAIGDGEAVLFCPECSGAFLANGKQRFCDRRCANRVMYRRWSQRHGKAGVRKKNRRSYAKGHGRRKVMKYRDRTPLGGN